MSKKMKTSDKVHMFRVQKALLVQKKNNKTKLTEIHEGILILADFSALIPMSKEHAK